MGTRQEENSYLKNPPIFQRKIDLSGIKGHMVENFIQGLNEIAPSSANLYITIIKLFFEYLVEAGYIERNPSTVLRKVKVVVNDDPSEDNNDTKAYTDKEVLQLMRSISGNLAARDKAIVAMLSGSGLRASELCSLTISQWNNMQNGHIYVRRKGGAMRWVAVASYVTPYVQDYLAERDNLNNEYPLFATNADNPLTRQMLYKILKRRQVESGLPPAYTSSASLF